MKDPDVPALRNRSAKIPRVFVRYRLSRNHGQEVDPDCLQRNPRSPTNHSTLRFSPCSTRSFKPGSARASTTQRMSRFARGPSSLEVTIASSPRPRAQVKHSLRFSRVWIVWCAQTMQANSKIASKLFTSRHSKRCRMTSRKTSRCPSPKWRHLPRNSGAQYLA